MELAVVILAAGQGTRMHSKLPKVLHPIAGSPMIEYSLRAAAAVTARKPIVIVGHQADQVRAFVGDRAEFVEQTEQRGTGHGVLQARELLAGHAEAIMVTYADMPLLTGRSLESVNRRHQSARACLTLLTVASGEAMGFGRVVRDGNGRVQRIVEESEATPAELAIAELNCGVYCFQADWLWEHLPRVKPSPRKQEYFLTDLVELAAREGAFPESEQLLDVKEALGINTRVQLARAEQVMRDRIRERVMLDGATLQDPASIYLDDQVEIGPDTVLLAGTHIEGASRIGRDCRIGPQAHLRSCIIGESCEIGPSVLEHARLEDRVKIGPYCHLRPGTVLGREVQLGDHAELKNARLGAGTKMGHFSYVGDAEVGERVNIGAGTITCNYDGKQKHRTVIGDDAFIGSDTMLVAPVSIGARAKTGAGSVVTHDIPDDALAYGVPARVVSRLEDK